MNSDRRAILALVAMGRITPGQAERLIAAWNDSRETLWILVLGLAFAAFAQLNLHQLTVMLIHLFNAQVPVLAESMNHAFSKIRI